MDYPINGTLLEDLSVVYAQHLKDHPEQPYEILRKEVPKEAFQIFIDQMGANPGEIDLRYAPGILVICDELKIHSMPQTIAKLFKEKDPVQLIKAIEFCRRYPISYAELAAELRQDFPYFLSQTSSHLNHTCHPLSTTLPNSSV
jgi:hypothetical protein